MKRLSIAGAREELRAPLEELYRSFDDVDRFLRERSLSADVLLDRDGKFGRANHADKLPTTLIYDARGNVKERFTGAQDWRAYELNRR